MTEQPTDEEKGKRKERTTDFTDEGRTEKGIPTDDRAGPRMKERRDHGSHG
jgi:hypothetical protein